MVAWAARRDQSEDKLLSLQHRKYEDLQLMFSRLPTARARVPDLIR